MQQLHPLSDVRVQRDALTVWAWRRQSEDALPRVKEPVRAQIDFAPELGRPCNSGKNKKEMSERKPAYERVSRLRSLCYTYTVDLPAQTEVWVSQLKIKSLSGAFNQFEIRPYRSV